MTAKIAAAGIIILLTLLALTGCSKTVHVTDKYRSAVGLYWVCTGPSWDPCVKGSVWRVSQAEYQQVKVGQEYTIH
jgi:hypothetical protein